jgi:hypothetical protein
MCINYPRTWCEVCIKINEFLEALKYQSLDILRGDQIYDLSMFLTESYAHGSTKVSDCPGPVNLGHGFSWIPALIAIANGDVIIH